MYVIIVGASKIGYNLAKSLMADNHEVVLIEKDHRKYDQLTKELGEVIVLGDGCEVSTLKKVGASRADMLIAVSGLDQENLITCQLAKLLFMVPKTLARVNDPCNEDLFRNLGVDLTVNTTNIINALISQKLSVPFLTPLVSFKNLEIVQAEIYDTSPAVNRQVKDLSLPPESLLIAALRGEEVVLLRGDSTILPNDTIIALTVREKESELRKIL
jgi:trk system potassium uptake protein TrkA